MKLLEWLPRESACDYALRVILYNIVHLELPPGSEVSSTKLSAALSLSRMPVREALSELSRMGLVEILPQRGSYISRIDYDLVEESRFMRLVLEVAVAKLACKGISREYLDAMEANLREYQTVWNGDDSSEQALELDNAFHRLMFASVNKLWTYQRLKDQMIHFDRLRTLSMSSIRLKAERTLEEHEDILYAIARRDEEMAEMVVSRHLSHYRVDLEALMEQYPDYFVKHREVQELPPRDNASRMG